MLPVLTKVAKRIGGCCLIGEGILLLILEVLEIVWRLLLILKISLLLVGKICVWLLRCLEIVLLGREVVWCRISEVGRLRISEVVWLGISEICRMCWE